MKLEHVALYVSDLERARAFFVDWLGGRSNEGYHNPKTGLRTYFISFDGGARLELMTRPDIPECGGTAPPKPGTPMWPSAWEVGIGWIS